MSRGLSLASFLKSHSTWIPCQNWSDWLKNAPKRIDMDGVIDRRPCTISLIARGATPIARAMAFCEIPIGLRYSSSRISPGVMEPFIVIYYNITGVWSMVILTLAGPDSVHSKTIHHCSFMRMELKPDSRPTSGLRRFPDGDAVSLISLA